MGSLATLRNLLGLEIIASGRTQAELCSTLGISEKHLSQFLVGHCGMSLDLLDRILAELGRELVTATRVRSEPAPTSREADR